MAGMKLLIPLSVLMLALGSAVDGGSDADVLLSALTTLMRSRPRSDDSQSCSAVTSTQGERDPALTMTLSPSTLDTINDFLNSSLDSPIDLLGLTVPTLDPLVVKHFAVDSTDPTLGKFVIKVNGINITGLSTIELSSVKLNILEPPLNLIISLGVTNLTLRTNDYYINASIADTFNLFGKGDMWFDAGGIKLYADIDLTEFSLSSLHINTLNLEITKFQSYFANLMGGGDTGKLINEVVDSIVPDLAQGLADIVKNMVNSGGLAGTTTVSTGTTTAPTGTTTTSTGTTAAPTGTTSASTGTTAASTGTTAAPTGTTSASTGTTTATTGTTTAPSTAA